MFFGGRVRRVVKAMIKLKSYGHNWWVSGSFFAARQDTVESLDSGAQSLRGPHPYLMYTQVDIEQFESRALWFSHSD